MGMSSSQARLLNLTARMHQIEYKAAKLEAEKLQMANESTRVYEDYLEAVDATKIQYATLTTDGSINYVDATYNSIKEQGYELKFADSDKVIIDAATEANLLAADGNRDYFIALQSGRVTETNQTVDGVVEIYTADQLMNMSSGKNYRLMSDIDMSGKSWTSKVLSTGKTFDGNGHSIKGLNNSLFSNVYGTVQNLNISGDVNSTAILAKYAYSNSTIQNVNVSGSVSSTSNRTGALVGTVSGSNITIQNCSANVNVTTSGSYAGTLIGYVNGTSNVNISNCSSSGYIEGFSEVGGLIGYAYRANITNCSSSAEVFSTRNETSDAWGGDNVSGGFIGRANACTITNCEARGNVKSNGGVIAGFAGMSTGNSTISNSNAYGNVASNIANTYTIPKYAAGFVSAVVGSTISNCNAYGTVTSNYDDSGCSSFVTFNMSGAADNYTDIITNCYGADTSHGFAQGASTIDTITTSTSPVSNTITVSGPSISTTTAVADTTNAGTLFDEIQKNGYVLEGETTNPVTGHEDDVQWFTNMVNAGELFIFDADDTTGELTQVSVATDTKLREVSNETKLRKAEAKYEADMKKIDNKDKKYDTDLAALETERNALKEEMETLKTVAKENVERTFKLFS